MRTGRLFLGAKVLSAVNHLTTWKIVETSHFKDFQVRTNF